MVRSPGKLTRRGRIALALAALGAPARAAEPCAIRLDPPDAEPAWAAAASAARQRIQASSDIDCNDVTIKVARVGAVVIFTTRDHRRAVREVATPGELGPTIEALSITLRAPASDTRATGGDATATTNANATTNATANATSNANATSTTTATPLTMRSYPEDPQPAASAESAPSGGRAHDSRTGAGVYGGARIAWPGPVASPVVGASFGFTRARWELGALAQWEPGYDDLTGGGSAVRTSALGLGVALARRAPLAASVDVGAGALVGGAAVHQSAPSLGNANRTTLEARAALHADALLSVARALRLRARLVLDAAPTRWLASDDPGFGFGRLPTFGASLTLGAEADL